MLSRGPRIRTTTQFSNPRNGATPNFEFLKIEQMRRFEIQEMEEMENKVSFRVLVLLKL